ncbi:MAG: methyltransferase domain-containing protein [Acidimicrobiales bacterium]|nr:methyltransferase domain-containing protein [Acidimicrobiales bacterium]
MALHRERKGLRQTFDSASELYHRARPDYPEELIDHIVRITGVRQGDHLLEIGCGSGKATLPLARRGFRITCIELSTRLAAVASENLFDFPDVEVVACDFEEWPLSPAKQFDLAFAATAWHWIDPEVRYRKAWDALRPEGHLALWGATHVFPVDGDPFFVEVQDVYEEIGEGRATGSAWPQPGELEGQGAEIADTGLFEVVAVRHFDWETSYRPEEYINLLNTSSEHIVMEQWKRDHLYGEIRRRLAARSDDRLRRHWEAVLHIARRCD